jgi:hypothetical protein
MENFILSHKKNNVKFNCELCHYNSGYKYDYEKHLLTAKHNMKQNEIAKVVTENSNLYCKSCDHTSSNKCNFEKHLLTTKHKMKQNETDKCVCGKIFNSRTTLWRHTKICETINGNIPIIMTPELSKNSILEIVKQNQEFKQLLVEQNQKLIEQNQKLIELAEKPSTIINSTVKNKFNLVFFLNEKCKDAMNITDFVSSLSLKLSDLENTGKHGFVEGVSRIFIKGLKDLDVYKRPIHCSDAKRETMYVKDQNIWEKEKDEKVKIHKTIRQIAHKNTLQIPKWIDEHPKCEDYYSKVNDQYLQIVNESMGGIDDEETNKYYNKIVKNVSKEVIIEEEK